MTIEEIAKNRAEAREHYLNLGACNTITLTTAEQITLDVNYAKAQAEYLKWTSAYNNKIKEMAAS